MSILIAILGFNLLVVLHELGHFLLARLTGMRVLKFSIGFGPALISAKRGDTTYQFALIPVGGFVQVAGMNSSEERDPDSYHGRPIWQRALMVSAGPVANLLFAVGLYLYLFASFNALSYEGGARLPTLMVREVSGPAEKAGLRPFDSIKRINDTHVQSFQELRQATGRSQGKPLKLSVLRSPSGERPPFEYKSVGESDPGLVLAIPQEGEDWKPLELEIQPLETPKGYLLGIIPDLVRFGAEDLPTAGRFAVSESYALISKFLKMLKRALEQKEEVQVASVVKITEVGADRVKMGSEWFLELLALLSLNLAFLNLLPLPALDGGRLLFLLIEAVARRPIPQRLEGLVHGIGILFLMGVMIWAVGSDLMEML